MLGIHRHKPSSAIRPTLLLHRCSGKIAASHIQLIPANRGRPVRIIQNNRLRRPQRFRAGPILINQRRHDFIAQGIQLYRCPVLRHQERAGLGECVDEPSDGNVGIRGMVGAETESRISRCAKINVKFPAMHLSQSHAAGSRAIDRDEKLISARRWRITRAKTSWNQTVGIAQGQQE